MIRPSEFLFFLGYCFNYWFVEPRAEITSFEPKAMFWLMTFFWNPHVLNEILDLSMLIKPERIELMSREKLVLHFSFASSNSFICALDETYSFFAEDGATTLQALCQASCTFFHSFNHLAVSELTEPQSSALPEISLLSKLPPRIYDKVAFWR